LAGSFNSGRCRATPFLILTAAATCLRAKRLVSRLIRPGAAETARDTAFSAFGRIRLFLRARHYKYSTKILYKTVSVDFELVSQV